MSQLNELCPSSPTCGSHRPRIDAFFVGSGFGSWKESFGTERVNPMPISWETLLGEETGSYPGVWTVGLRSCH